MRLTVLPVDCQNRTPSQVPGLITVFECYSVIFLAILVFSREIWCQQDGGVPHSDFGTASYQNKIQVKTEPELTSTLLNAMPTLCHDTDMNIWWISHGSCIHPSLKLHWTDCVCVGTVVQSHRCQQKELIVGRTSQTVAIYYPTVKVVPKEGNRLRENTFVRMRYRAPPGSTRTLSL